MEERTAPNILFLFPDQWRWDWLGCEDSPFGKAPVRTPNIDALARRGVRFTQCRTNSPLCAPARAALATGMRYHRCGVPYNGYSLDTKQNNFLKILRNAGYRVAVTGKPDLQKHSQWKGLDGWTREIGQLGFTESLHQSGKWNTLLGKDSPEDVYMNHLHQQGLASTHVADYQRRDSMRASPAGHILDTSPTPLPREHYTDDFCGQGALTFLEQWAVGEPWFLWVNFPGPHEPFDPPEELLRRYEDVEFPEPVHSNDTVNDHQGIRRSYAAMIEGIDEWVGRLVKQVEQRGELDNTLIVFASDHGEMLGDHGLWYKGVPHEPSIRVPLIMAGADVRPNRQSNALVELIDLSATLLEFAGLDVPQDWDARSIYSILKGNSSSHRDYQISELKEWRTITDGAYKLVEYANDIPQLYNLLEDPAEMQNLAKVKPDVVRQLSEQMRRLRGSSEFITNC